MRGADFAQPGRPTLRTGRAKKFATNLLATLSRRPEAYHQRVLAGPGAAGGSVIDANMPVKFKQKAWSDTCSTTIIRGKSLLDHFYRREYFAGSAGSTTRRWNAADFLTGTYEARLRRSPDRVQVRLSRSGNAWGIPLHTFQGGHAAGRQFHFWKLGIFELEGLPRDRTLHFSVEFNFAGLPTGADDRYFYGDNHQRLGTIGRPFEF